MKIQYLVVLLFIIISFDLSAINPYTKENQNINLTTQDSLILSKNNGKRIYVIEKGRKIKIWFKDKTEKGEFLDLKDDSLIIIKKGMVLKYKIDNITKIKVYGNLIRNIIGIGFEIWGGLIFVAGFSPLFAWGVAGFLISIPAWLVGFGIYKLGDFITGNRRFNLKKKWRINEQPINF